MTILDMIRKIKSHWNNIVTAQLRKISIFPRLITAFFLPLLVFFFVVFFSYRQYYTEVNNNLDRYISLLLQNVALKINETMQDYENIALLFYDDSRIIQALSENAQIWQEGGLESEPYEKNRFLIENKLYNVAANQKYIINMQVVTPYAQYHMAEENGYQRGGTIRDLDQFYESIYYLRPQESHGRPIWIDDSSQVKTFYKNEQNLYGFANIVTLEVAVYHPIHRDFLGVLLINIDLNAFSGAAVGFESYNDGNIFLAGSSGLLTGFQPSLSAPSYPEKMLVFSEMQKAQKNIIRSSISDQEVLLAYEKVPDVDFFTVYIADLGVLLERPRQIRNLCAAAFICAVLVCIILSYYVTISISSPIEQLIQVMQKAGDGKWKLRYESKGHDEISILGNRFNEMTDKTNNLIDQVYLLEIKRQKLLLSQKNAQMDALLMQINPHFLYNTLDIIRWEAMYEAGGESRVTEMIEKFSRLCRMSMGGGSGTIPLAEGLAHARTYLEVINFRHNDKIQLKLQTEADPEKLFIPRFLLQPFMENAIIHAFGDGSKGFRIRIHSFEKQGSLHILVEDNGKGMSREQVIGLEQAILSERAAEESIGLANVNQRIRLFYGDAYGIHIKSTPGTGTGMEIVLPLRYHSENMESMGATEHEATIGSSKEDTPT